jgi:hypothetical protein
MGSAASGMLNYSAVLQYRKWKDICSLSRAIELLTKKFLFSYEQPVSFGSAKAASKQAG